MTTYTTSAPDAEIKLGRALLILLIGGLLLGLFFTLTTTQYKLIFFSVLPIAFGCSGVIGYAIWEGNIRDRFSAILLVILLCIVVYGTYQFANYLIFRKLLADALARSAPVAQGTLDQQIDQYLIQNAGAPGFTGFITYVLKKGMSLTSGFPLQTTQQITGNGLLLYLLFDPFMLLLVGASTAWTAVSRRYCPYCARFYGKMPMGYFHLGVMELGRVERKDQDDFLRQLALEHWEQAGALLKKKSPGVSLLVGTERCESCTLQPVTVTVFNRHNLSRDRPAVIYERDFSHEEYDRLISFASVSLKHGLGPNLEWLVYFSIMIVFFSGLVWLLSVLMQSSSPGLRF